MLVKIANPIYDSVFKYLLEDERVARILISALLKKEVTKVECRPHEYVNKTRNTVSMFRIDFAATVREDDGTEHLVLVELQKTWLESETLRFRQYLGVQYGLKENVFREGCNKGYSMPMVAVYILGHTIGHIEEPVLYVNHECFDYDGNTVKKGIPDRFVESLTHDSIFVQLPLLSGRLANRLERVLSVFDQSHRDTSNHQFMHIDNSIYHGDSEMELVVRRLREAASDYDVRMDMNVEEEFFSALDDRDNALAQREKELAERNSQLAERDSQLAERNSQLAERNSQLAERDSQLAERDRLLRAMVKTMIANGMNVGQIADAIGESEEKIRTLLSDMDER